MARRALLAGAALALLLGAASVASAGERWTLVRRDGGREETTTVDVTAMPAAARDALLADYEARGWKRSRIEVTGEDAQLPIPSPPPVPRPPAPEPARPPVAPVPAPSPPAEAPAAPSIPVEALRPLARGVAALLRSFLEDRTDPAREKAWLALFRDLAEALDAPPAPGQGPDAETGAMLGRLLATLTRGAEDPSRRELVARLLARVGEGARPAPAAPARTATAGEASDDPLVAGGAHLHLVARQGGGTALVVEALDAGSVASQIGLLEGDAIVSVAGEPVGNGSPALLKSALSRPGELRLEVERREKRIAFDVEVVPPPRR